MLMLRPTDKVNIMEAGRAKCLSNHLCGDYLRLCHEDIRWNIEARKYNYNLFADTSRGIIKYKYDFSETFNTNLCNLVDKIVNKLEA